MSRSTRLLQRLEADIISGAEAELEYEKERRRKEEAVRRGERTEDHTADEESAAYEWDEYHVSKGAAEFPSFKFILDTLLSRI